MNINEELYFIIKKQNELQSIMEELNEHILCLERHMKNIYFDHGVSDDKSENSDFYEYEDEHNEAMISPNLEHLVNDDKGHLNSMSRFITNNSNDNSEYLDAKWTPPTRPGLHNSEPILDATFQTRK